MRKRKIQFVLLVGALLCFGNGSSLLAGTITQANAVVADNASGDSAPASTHEDCQMRAIEKPRFADESSAQPAARLHIAVPDKPSYHVGAHSTETYHSELHGGSSEVSLIAATSLASRCKRDKHDAYCDPSLNLRYRRISALVELSWPSFGSLSLMSSGMMR